MNPPDDAPADDVLPVADAGPRPPRRWPWLVPAFVLVGAAVGVERPWRGNDPDYGIVTQVAAEGVESGTAPEAGRLAPNFRLRTLDGGEVGLSDLRGVPVFLNFWATWCFSCVTEMPAMQKLADEYGERVVVLGVNVGEPVDTAAAFAANAGIRYPLVLDEELEVTKAYGVRAMPTSLFIDRRGVVHSVSYGVLAPAQMRERLAPLLTAEAA